MGVESLTVVVPVRNAEEIIGPCLESIVAARPREVIVVDGKSTDRTREIAASYPVSILSDEGRGLPAARRIGAEMAGTPLVALIDADVVLPPGSLERLVDEFASDGYTALQAGLHSVSGPGYWGRALAWHHRTGRSRRWFGVVATVFERESLLRHGFDDRFLSGEDIDLRWRLRRAGAKIGVSSRVVVEHRFGDDFDFVRGQWLADGAGLGRMVRTRGLRAVRLALLPLAAAVRGMILSLIRLQPLWIPYFLCFLAYNYVGMLSTLLGGRASGSA
jgi:glycosyltransferase involved in cell wall biosynthesis